MKKLYESFKIAFAMYSKIPMPASDWSKENMRYAMCFFPMIGAVIGVILCGFYWFSERLLLGDLLSSSIFVLLPVIITGGIHLDGFLDTSDALHSYQPVERKLEILKDPHTGAFAIISSCCYFVLALGVWSEVNGKLLGILAVGFVLSRSLSGLSIVTFPMAKNSGLAATFSENASKKRVKITMYVYIILCLGGMVVQDLMIGLFCFISAIIVFFYYRHKAIKEFGGITGDLAGYFLQICELTIAFVGIFVDKIIA